MPSHLKFVLAAALGLAASATAADAACRQAGGLATMPTQALSEFMANAALKNAIANHGWKAAGPIKVKCTDETLTVTCTARRRACD